MTKGVHKIATCCLVGTLAFMGRTAVTQAAGEPVAGVSIILDNANLNTQVTTSEVLAQLGLGAENNDVAIAQVRTYVNIRSKANTDSQVLGKLYNNSAAKILETVDDWYKVESGSVTGYIKSDYLITGEEAEELMDNAYTRVAEVTATRLNVRNNARTSSPIISKVEKGQELQVLAELEDWIKVSDGNVKGYVAADYVDLKTELKKAVSIEEEKEIAERIANNNISSIRSKLVTFALRHEGNRYVWGGTSLKYGADCSGFTQAIFKNFGISIPRTSRQQANSGRKVSISNMKPGDLIFYTKSGRINHVALYIGNGKVITASSRKEGVVIKHYNYRKPYKVVSYID